MKYAGRDAQKNEIVSSREKEVSYLGLRLKPFQCCLRNEEEEDVERDRGKYGQHGERTEMRMM